MARIELADMRRIINRSSGEGAGGAGGPMLFLGNKVARRLRSTIGNNDGGTKCVSMA